MIFKKFLNSEVVIIVYTQTEVLLEYTGFLSDYGNYLTLKNVEINRIMSDVQKVPYKKNIDELYLLPQYVISIFKK